jgi:hypothetical protein
MKSIVAILFCVLSLIAAALLFFGNPQSNKFIYMTQAYVWPAKQSPVYYNMWGHIRNYYGPLGNGPAIWVNGKKHGGVMEPSILIPDDTFSGTWYSWDSSGKAHHLEYANGLPVLN